MNKKYKSAFSLVAPSDESVERIFAMTEKKKFNFKPLLAFALISALLAASMITANAATDGAVLNSLKITAEEDEKPQEQINSDLQVKTVDGEKHVYFSDKVGNDYCVTFETESGTYGDCTIAAFYDASCESSESEAADTQPYIATETEDGMIRLFLEDLNAMQNKAE